jgi:ABC-type branched-subunit amino acid transport system ATPase component
MSAPLLQVAGLKVAYGGIEAVRQVDLELNAGEFVGIIGSNGAGKSSMLRAITGVVAPAAGTVTFAGEDITGRASRRSGCSVHAQVIAAFHAGPRDPRNAYESCGVSP